MISHKEKSTENEVKMEMNPPKRPFGFCTSLRLIQESNPRKF